MSELRGVAPSAWIWPDVSTVSAAFVATAAEQADFAAVMAWLQQQGHTGSITVHLLHGKPQTIDFPREPQRILLESR